MIVLMQTSRGFLRHEAEPNEPDMRVRCHRFTLTRTHEVTRLRESGPETYYTNQAERVGELRLDSGRLYPVVRLV